MFKTTELLGSVWHFNCLPGPSRDLSWLADKKLFSDFVRPHHHLKIKKMALDRFQDSGSKLRVLQVNVCKGLG